jgi:uncharacterized protein YndB with AHSA1/START domain
MTTTKHQANETEIVSDPTVPLVRITRDFDAPPAKVFRAHTDPELFAQWAGPRSITTRVDRWDCRTGGGYRYACVADGEEHRFFGSFHEVRPAELIVQTFTYEGVPEGVALERLVFEDLGDGRTRLTSTSLVDSFEARDAFVASGMEEGVREGYEKLDELLAR